MLSPSTADAMPADRVSEPRTRVVPGRPQRLDPSSPLTRLAEEVRAVGLDAGEAAHFGLESGAHALALDRVAWSGERPVEHRLGLAPSSRVALMATWGTEPPR